MKELWKSANILRRYGQEFGLSFYDSRGSNSCCRLNLIVQKVCVCVFYSRYSCCCCWLDLIELSGEIESIHISSEFPLCRFLLLWLFWCLPLFLVQSLYYSMFLLFLTTSSYFPVWVAGLCRVHIQKYVLSFNFLHKYRINSCEIVKVRHCCASWLQIAADHNAVVDYYPIWIIWMLNAAHGRLWMTPAPVHTRSQCQLPKQRLD